MTVIVTLPAPGGDAGRVLATEYRIANPGRTRSLAWAPGLPAGGSPGVPCRRRDRGTVAEPGLRRDRSQAGAEAAPSPRMRSGRPWPRTAGDHDARRERTTVDTLIAVVVAAQPADVVITAALSAPARTRCAGNESRPKRRCLTWAHGLTV